MFSPAAKYYQLTPELGKTRGQGKPSIVPWPPLQRRGYQIVSILGFQGLICLPPKNPGLQATIFLNSICSPSANASLVSLGFGPGYKNSGTDHLAQLKSKTKMVYQSLKGLFTFGGQAQIIFLLELHML